MPHILITTQIRLENGPTIVGDEFSNGELMDFLGAEKIVEPGNNFHVFKVDQPPRLVLDKLETVGFKLVAMSGVGQTCVWTMHIDASTELYFPPGEFGLYIL